MIEAEQLKYKLNSFQEPLEDLSGSLALEAKKERIDQLELNMEEPGFWDAPEESQKIMKELKDLQEHLKVIHALYSEYDDICTLIEMVDEEEDRSMVKEIEKDIAHFEEDFEKLLHTPTA